MAAIGDIELTCPHCGEKLPRVRLVTRTEASGQGELNITIHPHFDDAWKQRVYDEHPDCLKVAMTG